TLQFLISLNGMTDSAFDYTVPPRSSVRFTTRDPGSRVQSGYVLATAKGNDAVPEGISIFSVSDHAETVSETAVSPAPPRPDFQTDVDRLENRRFGLAVANPSASPTSVMFELFAIDGSSTNVTGSMQIPSGGHIERFVDELFPTIPNGFHGTLRIVATQPIGVTSLRFQSDDHGKLVVAGVPVIHEIPGLRP